MGFMDMVFKILIFAGYWWACVELAYILSPYDAGRPRAKYITIRHKFLAALVIRKHKPRASCHANSDGYKLSLTSFIAYLLQAVVLVAAVVLWCVPSIPCDPFELPLLSRRGGSITLYTWNETIPFVCISLLLFLELLCILLPTIIKVFRQKEPKVSWGVRILLVLIFLLFVYYCVYLLVNLLVNLLAHAV